MKDVLEQIKKRKWFLGIRREESLFFYSGKLIDREKFTLKYYKSNFVETILFPKKDNGLIRAFNLEQAKRFHRESKEKVLDNPKILQKFIDYDYKLWERIEKLGVKLKSAVEKTNFKNANKNFQNILKKYGEHGSYFFFIFSMGMMLKKNKQAVENARSVLEAHNKWRNKVAFKEEKMGERLFGFFKLLEAEKRLDVEAKDLMTFLTVEEAIDLANGKSTKQEIEQKIAKRQQNGFAYLYFRDKSLVLDNVDTIGQVKEYFDKMLEKEKNEMKGQVAFDFKENIKGEVIVVKDKSELEKADLAGKILVTVQTTPHFIPYLKNIKAIITDEGGITCHAAIVSRELKIPCVIGTKIATQVLKDGDKIEIDAEKEIVKIL